MASSNTRSERAISFGCQDQVLFGILHLPPGTPKTGVVMVVGGPQYRVGSHRLFVSLARHLSARGFAVLRFDCRGMGDSTGNRQAFEMIGPDIAAAVGALRSEARSITCVALWGLCDGASAICMYVGHDPSIAGIAMINPWARTDRGQARTYLKHYYLRRICDGVFWRGVVGGTLKPWPAIRSLGRQIGLAIRPTRDASAVDTMDLPERMGRSVRNFDGSILVVIAERDLTAREFQAATRSSKLWREVLAKGRIIERDILHADHTFSQTRWFEQMADATVDWLHQTSGLNQRQCSPN